MKSLFLSVSIILTLAALAGCTDSRGNLHPYGWTPAGGEFDSLTLEAERLYIGQNIDSTRMTVSRMRQIADRNPANRLLSSRATYWEGRTAIASGDIDGGMAKMRMALEKTDSAAYPYDYHRILWNLDMGYREPTLGRYRFLLAELDFFIKSGDKPIAGDYAMMTGTFLNDLGDTDNGMPYLDMADSLFRQGGFHSQVANNRINHVNAMMVRGDTIGAEIMMRELLADTVIPLSPGVRDIVLGNLYTLGGDTAALREAYRLVKDNPLLAEAQCMYENYLSMEALGDDDIPLAEEYHRRATASLSETMRPRIILDYLRIHSRLLLLNGQPDSAYHSLEKAAALSDSIHTSSKEMDIRNANLSHQIAEMKLQADIESRRETIILLSVTFCLLLSLLGGGTFLHRRFQRQKLAQAQDALRLERSNRKMMAMQLLMEEKEHLFHSMGEEMNELSEQGEISAMAASRLGSSLKIHSGMQAERDNFLETFGELDPAFSRRLRGRHPSLTDADTRLAGFIALGLDNKHIARVTGIRPESVKQARWRLRTKMGLASGESLEDAVRAFLSQRI